MTEIEIMSKLLLEKYKKVVLTQKELAEILGVSQTTIIGDRQEAIGIPYTRRNNKNSGQVLYSITAIAKHLVSNQIKVI